MHSFQNFFVRLIPNHPPPLETRIWKLVVRALVLCPALCLRRIKRSRLKSSRRLIRLKDKNGQLLSISVSPSSTLLYICIEISEVRNSSSLASRETHYQPRACAYDTKSKIKPTVIFGNVPYIIEGFLTLNTPDLPFECLNVFYLE